MFLSDREGRCRPVAIGKRKERSGFTGHIGPQLYSI